MKMVDLMYWGTVAWVTALVLTYLMFLIHVRNKQDGRAAICALLLIFGINQFLYQLRLCHLF